MSYNPLPWYVVRGGIYIFPAPKIRDTNRAALRYQGRGGRRFFLQGIIIFAALKHTRMIRSVYSIGVWTNTALYVAWSYIPWRLEHVCYILIELIIRLYRPLWTMNFMTMNFHMLQSCDWPLQFLTRQSSYCTNFSLIGPTSILDYWQNCIVAKLKNAPQWHTDRQTDRQMDGPDINWPPK